MHCSLFELWLRTPVAKYIDTIYCANLLNIHMQYNMPSLIICGAYMIISFLFVGLITLKKTHTEIYFPPNSNSPWIAAVHCSQSWITLNYLYNGTFFLSTYLYLDCRLNVVWLMVVWLTFQTVPVMHLSMDCYFHV